MDIFLIDKGIAVAKARCVRKVDRFQLVAAGKGVRADVAAVALNIHRLQIGKALERIVADILHVAQVDCFHSTNAAVINLKRTFFNPLKILNIQHFQFVYAFKGCFSKRCNIRQCKAFNCRILECTGLNHCIIL